MLTKNNRYPKIPTMLKLGMHTLLSTAFIGVTMVPAAFASKGGETSGGADRIIYSETMFRTKNPEIDAVKICFEKDATFKISDADISASLKWAYDSWANYIRLKDVNYAIWTGSEGMSLKVGSVHPGCSDADDLHVFLGVTPAKILPSLALLDDPIAAADAFTGYETARWKKGFIWFAKEGSIDAKKNLPVWPTPMSFRADSVGPLTVKYSNAEFREVLLHEMGHVFGNNHVDGTIMSRGVYYDALRKMEDASTMVWGLDPAMPSEDFRIDQIKELICNPGIANHYTLQKSYGYTIGKNGEKYFSNVHALEEVYTLLTGFVPTQALSATVSRAKSADYKPGRRAEDQPTSNLVIEFKDGPRTTSVVIEVLNKIARSDDSAILFNGQYGNHHRSSGFSYFGLVKTLTGKSIPVAVNYNMQYGTFQVVKIKGGDLENPLLIAE